MMWETPSLDEITAAEGRADERDIHIDNGNGTLHPN